MKRKLQAATAKSPCPPCSKSPSEVGGTVAVLGAKIVNLLDIPHELHIKIAESVGNRRDLRNFSNAGRSLKDAAINAFPNRLGLTSQYVYILDEILGSCRTNRLIRDLTINQERNPLPTFPNPLQLIRAYVSNTLVEGEPFLWRLSDDTFPPSSIDHVRAQYNEMLGEQDDRGPWSYGKATTNSRPRMKLQFKSDAEFVQFIVLLHHRPAEAVRMIDPFLLYHMYEEVRDETNMGSVPTFWTAVATFVNEVSGARPPSEYIFESFTHKAFELEKMGFDAVMAYIRTHIQPSKTTDTPAFIHTSRSAFVDLINFHVDHPFHDTSFFTTTFAKQWRNLFY
jgi:hypothetical protein